MPRPLDIMAVAPEAELPVLVTLLRVMVAVAEVPLTFALEELPLQTVSLLLVVAVVAELWVAKFLPSVETVVVAADLPVPMERILQQQTE